LKEDNGTGEFSAARQGRVILLLWLQLALSGEDDHLKNGFIASEEKSIHERIAGDGSL
jgi:hypothetical protein